MSENTPSTNQITLIDDKVDMLKKIFTNDEIVTLYKGLWHYLDTHLCDDITEDEEAVLRSEINDVMEVVWYAGEIAIRDKMIKYFDENKII